MSESLVEQTRTALKRFGKSISIVTAADGNGRYATPSSAITNLSYEPPTLLLPIEKQSSLYPLLSSGAPFCVNILGASHQEVVDACIKHKGEQRFAAGNWIEHSSGVPVLADAQASFVCTFEQLHEYETHGLLIGRIVDVNYSEQTDCLIYVDGAFKRC